MADRSSGQLVVVGSSAGGIDALSVLVAGLAPDFPAPILLAQHLDPNRLSHLAEILERRSTLPVTTVTDRAELRPGTIHVVPANRHVDVTDHEVRLSAPEERRGPVPSVDHVFTTAANVFGEGLIAVVLTGTGSDGAVGATRVKAAGGTVVVEDPETATFPSMPASLSPEVIDISASLDRIPALLHDLVRGAIAPPAPDDDRDLKRLLANVRATSGIDFGSYKRATVLRRLHRRIAATGAGTIGEYVRFADEHPEEYGRLATTMLIKVTEFYRDPDLFEHLRAVVIPTLIEEGRRGGRELRIWSAGCATGEEPYSLAILVAEALGDELPDWVVRIFATDLDGQAIAFARRGIYPRSSLVNLPEDVVSRWFVPVGKDVEVRKEIRALTVFGQHDLAVRAPFPRIDLALCRNVLIYFNPELQRRALQLFAFALRDGGWLALGKTETTTPLPEYFVSAQSRLRVYRRRGERIAIPAASESAPPVMRAVRSIAPPRRGLPPGLRPSGAARDRPGGRRADEVLAELPIGVLAVNREYDVVLINPAARRLLGIRGSVEGKDLLHLLADRAPAELRDAIDAAFDGRSSGALVAMPAATTIDGLTAWIRVDAMPGASDDGRVLEARLVIRDVTADRALADAATAGRDEVQAEIDRLGRQLDAALESNRRLTADSEELTTVNADLRLMAEEMLVEHEELQAASEEVETLNEELQSTNEELETLNEELQSTVEELNTTNDDMLARTKDLQEVATALELQRTESEAERSRLATIIETMADALVVVDATGTPILQNEAYRRLWQDAALQPDPEEPQPVTDESLRERAARGEEFGVQFRAVDQDGRRRWLEAYGRPVRAAGTRGGIVVVHDTTDLSLRRMQEELVAVVAHELRTPVTALSGYLQLLERQGGPQPTTGLAAEQAARLRRLANDLFDVSRVETGNLRIERAPLDLRALVAESIEVARSLSATHRIEADLGDGELMVEADAGRIQQVILNLLTNAIVHAPDSPTIEVRLRRLRRRAELEVEDHGPGIPSEQLGRIFSRFQHAGTDRRPSGLGIGLYISRQIVLSHDGAIEVDSAPGEGTTFSVRLPLALAPRASSGKTS